MNLGLRKIALTLVAVLGSSSVVWAQAVCLPAPRLLTTKPMGGQVGTSFDVSITGENLEEIETLRFSHPGITASPKIGDDGLPVADQFVVSIASDCPTGIHEARVMTRLGISSSRVFSVSSLPEQTVDAPNRSLDTAFPVAVDSVCNAVMTRQAIDFYSFKANAGQRVIIDCAAQGIDSKLAPVLIVADASGADLQVERRGGSIDFTAPQEGTYIIKVHDLTYSGGPHHFYRLVLRSAKTEETLPQLPSVAMVNAFSWPPEGLAETAAESEVEPNNVHSTAQAISLPCDISGSFAPAADVDTFEFHATQGEVWWVEVASERLGLPTDPSIVVQHVTNPGTENETLTDVAELSDIPSPVKVSSNGYSYDGPPYNAGSSDILGKLEIKQTGLHRLQIRDLFGGTRNDPRNVYRLVIRKASPDFALVAWALHMNLRNGDRNALSKPIALRGGATMPLEVVAIRRDGFDGPIELSMEDLPEGVSAAGMTIPAGASRGIMLVSADENAPRGLASAKFVGRASIGDTVVTRPCRLASMQWPVPNAWSEVPSPRLLADVPVSVCGAEQAPITIASAEDKVFEATAGEKLTIPLRHTRRMEFSGATISLKTFGAGFEKVPSFEVPLTEDASEAVIDFGALKTPPGDYQIAFYGSAVAKYRYNPGAVILAETALKAAKEEAARKAERARELAEAAKAAAAEQQQAAEAAAQQALAEQKQAEAAVATAEKELKSASAKANPKDIVDIIVSKPISIRVLAAEKAE